GVDPQAAVTPYWVFVRDGDSGRLLVFKRLGMEQRLEIKTSATVVGYGVTGILIASGRRGGVHSIRGWTAALKRLWAMSVACPPLLPIGPDTTTYRRLTGDGVDVIDGPGGRRFLTVDPALLTLLTDTAMHDIAHFLRPAHLAQLRAIVDDPAASPNDRFV